MAGDWIKMRVDLKDDPSVFKLAEMLAVDELHVIGCLFCFWAWADKHAVDGHVDGATSRLVDKVSSTPGFCSAMQAVGWLVIEETGISIPHFDRHNGESAKERGLKNARQARWRAGKADHVDASPSTDASTREEKRREEKKEPSPVAPKGADCDPEGFVDFWSMWPASDRKNDRKKCAAKWKRSGFSSKLPLILAHVEALKDSKQWRDGFEPAPLTYLNGERWGDGMPSESAQTAGFL